MKSRDDEFLPLLLMKQQNSKELRMLGVGGVVSTLGGIVSLELPLGGTVSLASTLRG